MTKIKKKKENSVKSTRRK